VTANVSGIALMLKRATSSNTRVLTMKKANKKKSAAKKASRSVKKKPAPALRSKPKGKKGLVNKQPQVKQQAAVANGMFLYVDDAWSLQYFDQNDLHFKEREVFG
jgi:hypothetical protein